MITAITLENFKGISEPVTIPLRPLTIMFGKNSAGKSTIIQALHYAREILERNNLDPDRTLYGGTSIDLGGFQNLVNNHDVSKPISMKFEMDLRVYGLPDIYSDFDTIELCDDITLEFVIEWSHILKNPVITNCKTWIGSIEAVRFERTVDHANFNIEYNANHPLLFLDEEISTEKSDDLEEEVNWTEFKIYNVFFYLPEKNSSLYILKNETRLDDDLDNKIIDFMLMAPIDSLRWFLEDFRYIGPLRKTPPRNFQVSITKEEADWSNGLAAWNELYNVRGYLKEYPKSKELNRDRLIFETSRWLSSEKLNTGYQIKLKQFREIPLDSELMQSLVNNTVFDDFEDTAESIKKFPIGRRLVLEEERSGLEVLPNDIGIGISQVVPIIVASLISENQIIVIEQPELHLHPAVQAELGDLFIESAFGGKNNFLLLETHSEHLILRLLRRIRESAGGNTEVTGIKVLPNDVQLLFVEPSQTGTTILELPITDEGDFEKNVPGGFFAERAKELF